MNGGVVAGVNFITVDGSGNKWFGTEAGLAKFDGSNWTVIDTTVVDSLLDNNITSIAIDASNNKWIGTLFGITKLNSSNAWVKNYRKTDGLYNNGVRDIDFDGLGNMWLGLYTDYNNEAGVTKFNGSAWTSQGIDYPDSVSADWIYRQAVDKNNDVWVAMDYGVLKIDHASSINQVSDASTYLIYPNPTTGIINLKSEFTSENTNIFIIDETGRMVMQKHNESEIDLTGLEEGVYYLAIEKDNLVVSKNKIVLMK